MLQHSPHPYPYPPRPNPHKETYHPQTTKPPPTPTSGLRPNSFADAVKGSGPSGGLSISLSSRDFHPPNWSVRAIVAKAKTIGIQNETPKLLELALKDSRFELAYLGGLCTLVTFPTPQLAEQFLKYYRVGLNEWFSSFGIMTPSEVPRERIAILRIYGLPYSLWHKQVSNEIGNLFGKILEESTATSHDHNLSYDKITVLTGHKKIVNETVSIRWKPLDIQITVHEEETDWSPSFFSSQATGSDPKTSGVFPPPMLKSDILFGNTNAHPPPLDVHPPHTTFTTPHADSTTSLPPLSHNGFFVPHPPPITISPANLKSKPPTTHFVSAPPCPPANLPSPPLPHTVPLPSNFDLGITSNNRKKKPARDLVFPPRPNPTTQSVLTPIPLILPPPPFPGFSSVVPETQPMPDQPMPDQSLPDIPPPPLIEYNHPPLAPPSLQATPPLTDPGSNLVHNANITSDPVLITDLNQQEIEATLNVATILGIDLTNHVDSLKEVVLGEGEDVVCQ